MVIFSKLHLNTIHIITVYKISINSSGIIKHLSSTLWGDSVLYPAHHSPLADFKAQNVTINPNKENISKKKKN